MLPGIGLGRGEIGLLLRLSPPQGYALDWPRGRRERGEYPRIVLAHETSLLPQEVFREGEALVQTDASAYETVLVQPMRGLAYVPYAERQGAAHLSPPLLAAQLERAGRMRPIEFFLERAFRDRIPLDRGAPEHMLWDARIREFMKEYARGGLREQVESYLARTEALV